MGKTKNSFYRASSIVAYVVAGLSAVSAIFTLIKLIAGDYFTSFYTEFLESEMAAGTAEADAIQVATAMADAIIAISYVFVAFEIASVVVGFIVASKIGRLSYMTDEEAFKTWGKSIAWVVLAFIFTGLVAGGLAVAGLCTTHRQQKNKFAEGRSTTTNATTQEPIITTIEEEPSKDKYSEENITKMQARLEQLESLKASGVLSDEEYNSLRSKIIESEK